MSDESEITRVLQAYGRGEKGAFDRLMPLVYESLRRVAKRQLRGGDQGRTLNTTGLVHEAYLKLVDQTRVSLNDRGHFFAIASRAMRQILIDRARRRRAVKRGADAPVTDLDELDPSGESFREELLAVDEALDRLTELDPRLVQLVECRYFAGLTEEETAEALGVSVRTVQRQWQRARAWLKDFLRGGPQAR